MESQAPSPTLSAQPQPPPIPKPQHKPNWLKWLLVIVAVALLSSVTTYVVLTQQQPQQPATPRISQPTPTPDPTANWKTYTGVTITFNYPLDWNIREEARGGEAGALVLSNNDQIIEIIASPFYPTSVLEDSILTTKDCQKSDCTIQNKTVEVGKQKAIIQEVNDLQREIHVSTAYVSNNSSTLYRISLLKVDNYSKSIFNQILSTFGFN